MRTVAFIQSVDYSQNSIGSPTQTWIDSKRVKGHFHSITGMESYKYSKKTADSTNYLIIRYDDSITEENRIRIKAKLYDINFVEQIDDYKVYTRIYLELLND